MNDISLNICTDPVISKNKKASLKNKDYSDVNDETNCGKVLSNKKNKNKGKKSSLFKDHLDIPALELNDEFTQVEESLFSSREFKDCSNIHPYIISALEQLFNINKMTTVQQLSIPPLLAGQDALVRSQTGSGKTLAYAIPILHALQNIKPKIDRSSGVRALIVLPTRELALQTYEWFLKLVRAFARIVPGILIGGEKRKSEKARLRKGINILIGTPGRLIDHVKHTASLNLSQVSWLVLDEADKLLEMGYERDVGSLLENLDNVAEVKRQTVLLSATLTPGVERLAGLALDSPARIDSANAEENDEALVVPNTLKQIYIIANAKLRLVSLASFLLHVCQVEGNSKVLVFMATQDMVDYFTELLPRVMDPEVELFKLHGNMSHSDRTEVFKSFRAAKSGVLFSTDVAARGLDMPLVDWIVQYNSPRDPSEYVHRVGRTARAGTKGHSVIFLLPSETQFLQWLANKRIKLKEVSIEKYLGCLSEIEAAHDSEKYGGGLEGAITALQHTFENTIQDDDNLHDLARKAYTSWVRFYMSYPKEARTVFDFKMLHLGHHAKSFALTEAPTAIGGRGKSKNEKKNGKKKSRDGERKKSKPLKLDSQESRTKRLMFSEYDSGLPPIKKHKAF